MDLDVKVHVLGEHLDVKEKDAELTLPSEVVPALSPSNCKDIFVNAVTTDMLTKLPEYSKVEKLCAVGKWATLILVADLVEYVKKTVSNYTQYTGLFHLKGNDVLLVIGDDNPKFRLKISKPDHKFGKPHLTDTQLAKLKELYPGAYDAYKRGYYEDIQGILGAFQMSCD